MNTEQLIYPRLGIRKEYDGLKLESVLVTTTAAGIYHLFHPVEIVGELPKKGKALLYSNHTGETDIFKVFEAARKTAGRVVRGIAKEPLTNPHVKDSKEVLERTGKQNSFINSDHRLAFALRWYRARILNGIGAGTVKRDGNPRDFVRTMAFARRVLELDQMVGIFLQETRVKEGDLRDLKIGAALLAMKNPDVDVYPIGITPDRVQIFDPFTYNQLLREAAGTEIDVVDLTLIMADKIAPALSSEDWTTRRFIEKAQLSSQYRVA